MEGTCWYLRLNWEPNWSQKRKKKHRSIHASSFWFPKWRMDRDLGVWQLFGLPFLDLKPVIQFCSFPQFLEVDFELSVKSRHWKTLRSWKALIYQLAPLKLPPKGFASLADISLIKWIISEKLYSEFLQKCHWSSLRLKTRHAGWARARGAGGAGGAG